MNLEIVWNNFLQKIKEDLTPLSYETWFQDTRLVSLKDNTAFVIVPMESVDMNNDWMLCVHFFPYDNTDT